MRFFCSLLLTIGLVCSDDQWAFAQAELAGGVVALDDGSAELLKLCSPQFAFKSLVRSENESYQSLNDRAWSMRNAGCLVYRGDQLSGTSKLFRDRLIAQGVPAIDLAIHVLQRNRAEQPVQTVNWGSPSVSERKSFVMTLAIDLFTKAKLGL